MALKTNNCILIVYVMAYWMLLRNTTIRLSLMVELPLSQTCMLQNKFQGLLASLPYYSSFQKQCWWTDFYSPGWKQTLWDYNICLGVPSDKALPLLKQIAANRSTLFWISSMRLCQLQLVTSSLDNFEVSKLFTTLVVVGEPADLSLQMLAPLSAYFKYFWSLWEFYPL